MTTSTSVGVTGNLASIARTSVREHYGLKTLLYGNVKLPL